MAVWGYYNESRVRMNIRDVTSYHDLQIRSYPSVPCRRGTNEGGYVVTLHEIIAA